jgi:hypothetical protein
MWIRAAGLYLVAAGLVTWPLVIQLTSRLGALEGAGDPFLNLWILGWGMDAWLADPLAVLGGRAFDANIFHPAAGALTYSDHLLLQSLVMTPLYAVTGNLVLCYNVLLVLSIAASGLAMHLLVRSVTGSTAAAFVAGLAWACWPYRTAHLLHLQLQSLYFLPLALWALHRVVAARRWKDVWLLAVFAALQAVSSVYYGLMTAIAVAVAALVLAVGTGQWRSSTLWSRLAASAAIGALLIAPIAWPYWRTQQREGFGRNLFEAAAHAAAVQSYTQVPPDNLLYGRTGLMDPRDPAVGARDRRHVEHQMFPGLVIVALAVIGLWRTRRSDARAPAASAAALVVTGVVLSLGPEGLRSVYAWFADVVFGFQAIRAPARFAVVAMAGLCLLAGLAVARFGLRPPVIVALAALMMLEYANAPLAFVAAPATSTEAGRWLKAATPPGAVVYLPLALDRENSVFMVQSLEHKRPIVNGYSGQRPSFFTSFVDAFADPSSIEARAVLKDAAVRYVVSPTRIESAGDPSSPFVERARVAEGLIYELVWTAESEAALEAAEVSAPPPPGDLPFVAGETATYEAVWLSGPLDIPAGTITLSVRGGPSAFAPRATADTPANKEHQPAWVFEARMDTAPWVSRFFEAHDRFETRADAQLKPLSHVRIIREGRRSVDRAFVFDHEARRVRSANTLAEAGSASAVALPLSAGSLDTLTALWYIRALPLAPGLTVVLPVNDGGRGLVVTVRVHERERIEVGGRSEEAFRVEPRITARVERRQPIDATFWLSADARRLPLVAEIAAGFGRIRLNLVNYRP